MTTEETMKVTFVMSKYKVRVTNPLIEGSHCTLAIAVQALDPMEFFSDENMDRALTMDDLERMREVPVALVITSETGAREFAQNIIDALDEAIGGEGEK